MHCDGSDNTRFWYKSFKSTGHVAKGTQLQNFRSVGKRTTAQNTNLKLSHGSTIYVTVTAKNKADLTAVAYSDEVVVDRTAPVMSEVFEGESEGN